MGFNSEFKGLNFIFVDSRKHFSDCLRFVHGIGFGLEGGVTLIISSMSDTGNFVGRPQLW